MKLLERHSIPVNQNVVHKMRNDPIGFMVFVFRKNLTDSS